MTMRLYRGIKAVAFQHVSDVPQDDLVELVGVLSPASLVDVGEDLRPTIS
jgi:hypothetical protein